MRSLWERGACAKKARVPTLGAVEPVGEGVSAATVELVAAEVDAREG